MFRSYPTTQEAPIKDFLAGCGFVTIALIIIIVVAVVIGTQCGSSEDNQLPTATAVPPTPPPLVNAWDVYREYQLNETRANSTFKGKWLTVELGQIDRIDDGGRVLMNMDAGGWNQTQLDFKDDSAVLPLNPGQPITAVCKLSGLTWDSLLIFKDCRFP